MKTERPLVASFAGSTSTRTEPRHALHDPATGLAIAEVVNADAETVGLAASAAEEANQAIARASARVRSAWLRELAGAVEQHLDHLAMLETLCVGKPLRESTATTGAAVATLRYYADLLDARDRHETSQTRSVLGGRFELERLPLGVIAHILPWNFPVSMASARIAMSIASGSACVLKASELAPLTPVEIARLAASTSLPPGAVNVVVGGPESGAELIRRPEIAAISFTGGSRHGAEVMKTAAELLKPVTLELGGRCVGIVLRGADLAQTVDGAARAAFTNAGQSCSAATRLFMETGIADEFRERFVKRVQRLRVGPGLEPDSDLGPLISGSAKERVGKLVEQGIDRGARRLTGGTPPSDTALQNGNFFLPTVLEGIEGATLFAEEEPFGPVTVLETFADEAELIDLLNSSPFRLAAGIWGQEGTAMTLARELRLGVVWVNTYNEIAPEAPWGGFASSGFGRILGEDGLLEFTAPRVIYAR